LLITIADFGRNASPCDFAQRGQNSAASFGTNAVKSIFFTIVNNPWDEDSLIPQGENSFSRNAGAKCLRTGIRPAKKRSYKV
jgi:hypothetical protein